MENSKYFYYKKSRMSQLRSFCAVVKNNCVAAKAAKEINVEPATITKQLQSLEYDLDIVLFDRSEHKKLKLTKEGNLFYKQAVKYLNGINSLFDNFSGKLKEYNKIHLNIALYYTAATYIFPKILGAMLKIKKFKNLNVKILEISRDDAIKGLKEKEIDLAFYPFITNEEIPSEFEAIKSIKNHHAVILSKNHSLANKEKLTREDLENQAFLIRNTTNNLASPMSIYKHLNLKPANITFKNTTINTTMELIRHTDTITGIPRIIFNNYISKIYDDIICKNIDHILPESHFYIMKLKDIVEKDSVKFVIKELEKLDFC